MIKKQFNVNWNRLTTSRNSHLCIVVLAVCSIMGLTSPCLAQRRDEGRYSDARSLVSRVQQDLQHAESMASQHKHSKETERINNALRHLSDLDRSLSKGKFDSGRVDRAISDLQNVLDHNTLAPEDRDNLNADLRDLRSMRSTHGR
ncbi:MAG TPA: hypothetical protein VEZ90_14855 [Blastocatellia bacterium]|nr:hypothetical protein [Blastocatellia bacterium]